MALPLNVAYAPSHRHPTTAPAHSLRPNYLYSRRSHCPSISDPPAHLLEAQPASRTPAILLPALLTGPPRCHRAATALVGRAPGPRRKRPHRFFTVRRRWIAIGRIQFQCVHRHALSYSVLAGRLMSRPYRRPSYGRLMIGRRGGRRRGGRVCLRDNRRRNPTAAVPGPGGGAGDGGRGPASTGATAPNPQTADTSRTASPSLQKAPANGGLSVLGAASSFTHSGTHLRAPFAVIDGRRFARIGTHPVVVCLAVGAGIGAYHSCGIYVATPSAPVARDLLGGWISQDSR